MCVKWVLAMCLKKALTSVFDINFDAAFTTSSQDIMVCNYFQINSLYCPIWEEKCQVYFESHCIFMGISE